jgi:uncharacterized OB-fold protein
MANPIAPDLIEVDASGPRLIGGRHKETGRIKFPFPSGMDASHYEKIALAGEGKLWSFTVQRFRPKSPPYGGADDERSFKPYAVGYVELPGQIIVEARLDTDDFAKLKVGMAMKLAAVPFARAGAETAITYAFRPVA